MIHRMLILMLVFATLVGSSVCCCAMSMAGDEAAGEESCCCQSGVCDETSDDGNSDQHECPCRQNRTVSARIDDVVQLKLMSQIRLLLQAWCMHSGGVERTFVDLATACSRMALSECDLLSGGQSLLTTLCVNRC